MAKRKFGRYSVDIKKNGTSIRPDGLTQAICTITGDIEIGIDIEPMTWREDWLAQQLFGEEATKYRLINAENNYAAGWNVNQVTSVWYKRS